MYPDLEEDRFALWLYIVIVKGEFPRLIYSSAMMGSVVGFDAAVERMVSLAGPAWKDQG